MTFTELYSKAKNLINHHMVSPFIESAKVAAAIETEKGNVYYGVNIKTSCDLGLCAERNAIANMLTHGENSIKKVVTVMEDGKLACPCGACREFLMQLSEDSGEMEILMNLNPEKTVKLKELMPNWWGYVKYDNNKEEIKVKK